MLTQVTEAVRQSRTINPKTVLGFYATILGLLLTGAVGAITVLGTTHTQTSAIPWILAFCGIILLLMLVGVFLVTLKDPSKLMLTQVSGEDYLAIQQKTIVGDSLAGERIVEFGPPTGVTMAPLIIEPAVEAEPTDSPSSVMPTESEGLGSGRSVSPTFDQEGGADA